MIFSKIICSCEMRSYMTFTERAVAIIKQIPEGKVMTYGQIAGLAGSPRGARQVVRILHSMSKSIVFLGTGSSMQRVKSD